MTEISALLNNYPYLNSVLLLTVSLTLALLANFIIGHLVKPLIKKTKTTADDEILKALKKPVFWSFFLTGFYYVLIDAQVLSEQLSTISNTIITTCLLIWTVALIRITSIAFGEAEKKARMTHNIAMSDVLPFLENLTKLILVAIVGLTILSSWNIDIRPVLTSAGVAGVAVAFAAKDTIANLFGGISVFFDHPYKTGDYVIINDKHRGQVIEIGMRSTKLKTRDNVLLTIPNSVMVTNAVINETGFDPKLRIRIPVIVAYDSDLEKVERTIYATLATHEEVLKNPKPVVRFREFVESGIMVEGMAVIGQPSERGRVMHELIKMTHKGLDIEGIKIPFPQRDIHIINDGS